MLSMHRQLFLGWLLFLFAIPNLEANELASEDLHITKILSVTVDSSINPATYSYLQTQVKRAETESYDAFLIKLNTPGGLVSTTKDILTMMGDSKIPTFVWITPEGASASSAGAIIASGAHVLAMSAGTNIGAATPIQLGKDIEGGDLRRKAINDLVALVQSLSESRSRNADLFGKMVEDAASFKSEEALEHKLIDFIAGTDKEFISKLNGFKIKLMGHNYKLVTNAQTHIDNRSMDLGQELLNVLASPNLSYVLFLMGAALIYFEFQTTGFVAGSLGAICMVLAGIGFQVLPLNFGALGLIILAFVMFLLETYITSHGLLSVIGLGSLLIGSLFLFRTDQAYIAVSKSLIYTSVGSIALFILGMLVYLFYERRKQKVPKDFYSLLGKEAFVVSRQSGEVDGLHIYQVRVAGEIWQAQSQDVYEVGDKCTVKEEMKGMILKI